MKHPKSVPLQEETFCYYCQRDYKTPKQLRTHVLKIHPATYRAAAYLKEDSHERA